MNQRQVPRVRGGKPGRETKSGRIQRRKRDVRDGWRSARNRDSQAGEKLHRRVGRQPDGIARGSTANLLGENRNRVAHTPPDVESLACRAVESLLPCYRRRDERTDDADNSEDRYDLDQREPATEGVAHGAHGKLDWYESVLGETPAR